MRRIEDCIITYCLIYTIYFCFSSSSQTIGLWDPIKTSCEYSVNRIKTVLLRTVSSGVYNYSLVKLYSLTDLQKIGRRESDNDNGK